MKYNTIGIDISKHFLDICTLPDKKAYQYPNTPEGFQRFLSFLKKNDFNKIIMENTGCYHKNFEKFLLKHYPENKVVVANPQNIRNFARSCGVLAKTDKIDAFIIADFGQKIEFADKIRRSEDVEKLRALVNRRAQLVDHRKREKNYKESSLDDGIVSSIKEMILFFDNQIKDVEKEIKKLLKNNQILNKIYKRLKEIKAVGDVSATRFLTDLPELGLIDNKKISALVGVAPMARDSGKMTGKRFIKGGRPLVRDAMYQGVSAAIRSGKGVLFDYYSHLSNRGKAHKVAVIACIRKLLVYINGIVKNEFYNNTEFLAVVEEV